MFGARFHRTSSHLVLRNSLLGGLVLAEQGGMTLAQAVKKPKPQQERMRKKRSIGPLDGLKVDILMTIFL
jgi:hypothetical protein